MPYHTDKKYNNSNMDKSPEYMSNKKNKKDDKKKSHFDKLKKMMKDKSKSGGY